MFDNANYTTPPPVSFQGFCGIFSREQEGFDRVLFGGWVEVGFALASITPIFMQIKRRAFRLSSSFIL